LSKLLNSHGVQNSGGQSRATKGATAAIDTELHSELYALVSTMKKKIKEQKSVIKLLKNQIRSCGMNPLEEIVTYSQAEERLKESLGRLLMGDESATAEFEKWDHFVRNHPEYKIKEENKKIMWKRDNEAINLLALKYMRSLVPPDIVTNCTLKTLESNSPNKAVAKRIWTKKALWLTRIPKERIARLHIADLQTKYSVQGLDEVELRAVYCSLPEQFENDANGTKSSWRNDILDVLKAKRERLPWSGASEDHSPSKREMEKVLSEMDRNAAYRCQLVGWVHAFIAANDCPVLSMSTLFLFMYILWIVVHEVVYGLNR